MAKKVEFNIELVKKWIFWVLIPVVLLLVFVFNFLAVGTIGKKFKERKDSLESTKNTVDKIRQDRAHPNKNTIDEIKVRTEELRERFVAAWTTLEKDQRARNVWPTDLGTSFIEEVRKLKFGDIISVASLENYLNFMRRNIPKLEAALNRKRIQVNEAGVWKDREGAGADTFRGFNSMNRGSNLTDNNLEREVGIVEWPNPEIRNIIMWDMLPSSIEVWYAQEELWVYDSLISVIVKSNAGARSSHSAVVKRIESMLIGQQASHEVAKQLSVRTTGISGDGMSDSGASRPSAPTTSTWTPPNAAGPGARMPTGGTGVSEVEIGKMKRHERYVDANNVPLAADAPPPFGEFNRMPICLRLIVDRQRIPDILVNCANCAMPIDVLSIRINPGSGDANIRHGNQNLSAARTTNIGSGIDIGKQTIMDGSSGLDSIYGSNSVPIEIYGCINIFNPVDQNIIKKIDGTTP